MLARFAAHVRPRMPSFANAMARSRAQNYSIATNFSVMEQVQQAIENQQASNVWVAFQDMVARTNHLNHTRKAMANIARPEEVEQLLAPRKYDVQLDINDLL